MTDGFSKITSTILPMSCAQRAIDALFDAGRRQVEGVALFAGTREGDVFTIQKTIVPKQLAGSVEEGLLYVVKGDELHRIGLDLFDSGQQLFAQIHSHPRAAYHSETDDAYPIVTVLGGLSIVVPNFAKGGVNLQEWEVYRLYPQKEWRHVPAPEKQSLITIVNDIPTQKKRTFKIWPWR